LKEAPIFRRLESVKDLARLACAFERIARPIFAIPAPSGGFALSVHAEQLGETPVFFFVSVQSYKPYLRYRADNGIEEVSMADEATLPQYLHAPILSVKAAPEQFTAALGQETELGDRVQRMELGDVNSLLKLGAYRYVIDESYAPVYLIRERDELHLGTFVHMGDYDGSDFYFYVKMDRDPDLPFVKFDPSKPSDWAFTPRTAEHGYYYAKVIRLAEDSL
jgi:hypothetical protein